MRRHASGDVSVLRQGLSSRSRRQQAVGGRRALETATALDRSWGRACGAVQQPRLLVALSLNGKLLQGCVVHLGGRVLRSGQEVAGLLAANVGLPLHKEEMPCHVGITTAKPAVAAARSVVCGRLQRTWAVGSCCQ